MQTVGHGAAFYVLDLDGDFAILQCGDLVGVGFRVEGFVRGGLPRSRVVYWLVRCRRLFVRR